MVGGGLVQQQRLWGRPFGTALLMGNVLKLGFQFSDLLEDFFLRMNVGRNYSGGGGSIRSHEGNPRHNFWVVADFGGVIIGTLSHLFFLVKF